MPVKIAAAGGNICDHAGQKICLKWHNVSQITGPATLLTNPENAYNTFTVGSSSLFHLRLAVSDGSKV
jgi:hypothetical protein